MGIIYNVVKWCLTFKPLYLRKTTLGGKMNINNLSLQKIVGNDWRYYPDFQYADFSGKAELHKADRIILFRKENDVSVISLQAIGLCDKDLIRTADKLLMEIGLDLRMGDSRNKIVKKFGTPDLIDCIEEGYFRYFDYNYEFTDKYLITRYHYLLAPNLLICFGIPKEQYQKLTDLEIVNDYQMVSAIMEKRIAHKKCGNEIFPCNDRLRFIHQTITNRLIEDIHSKIVYFFKTDIKDCNIKEIYSETTEFEDCVFEHIEFMNHYRKGYFSMRSCIFKNCIFHDTFGSVYLFICDNIFEDCLFEGIRTSRKTEGAFLLDNTFKNCIFRDMTWVGYGLYSNKVSGGKMKQIHYHEYKEIYDNQFLDVQMEDIEVEMEDYTFLKNKLYSVTFRNVILKGQMEKNNKFKHCDTSGLTYL